MTAAFCQHTIVELAIEDGRLVGPPADGSPGHDVVFDDLGWVALSCLAAGPLGPGSRRALPTVRTSPSDTKHRPTSDGLMRSRRNSCSMDLLALRIDS